MKIKLWRRKGRGEGGAERIRGRMEGTEFYVTLPYPSLPYPSVPNPLITVE